MSAKVNICSVNVLDNPAKFTAAVAFEITFEAFEQLPEDLEWKIIYVGSAESDQYDQLLDSVLIGPTPEGIHRFRFEADCPKVSDIPSDELVGVTVVLLACSYRGQQFITIGFYVSVEYEDPELIENPPNPPIVEKLTRRIATEDPRVTRYPIKWTEGEAEEGAQEQPNTPVCSSAQNEVSDTDMEQQQPHSAAGQLQGTSAEGALSDLTNGHHVPAQEQAVCGEPQLPVISAAQQA